MKDLYRCLEDQLPELLQAIAAAWHVTLPEGDARTRARVLGDAMLETGALAGVLSRLMPAARSLLDDIVRAGGALPAQRLTPAYGSIRRDGPARLAREQPWQQPANPLEELYFRGLVDRANGTVGTYTGQVVLVPTQLVERLAPYVTNRPLLDVAPVEAPATVHDDGSAVLEDLFALFVAVRHGHIPAPVQTSANLGLHPWPRVDLGPRLQGAPDPLRLALIAQLAYRLGLIREAEGWLRPGPRAREWLRIPDIRRQRSAFVAWRDDRNWSEFAHLINLRCDETVDPVAVRRALLEQLTECPSERWFSVASFVQAVKRRRPDFLRGDGDYTAWRVTDVVTGEHLIGPGSWDRVEGALAEHMLLTSLRWLGLVALGPLAGQDGPGAMSVTALGKAVLGRNAAVRAPTAELAGPLATVSEDLTIAIAPANSLYERYQLERFAQWEAQAARANYRVTPDSLWRGYNAGVEVAQVVRFLVRISGDRVPAPAMRDLLAWGGRFGRVRLHEMLLLQTDDERTMEQITSRKELAALLGTVLSPTSCLVERSKANQLIEQLRELGIWPKLEG